MENELTTADVYETASLIGKDIEQIIELYGHSAVVNLMPKVVEVLEQLEICVGERENCLLELEGMRLQNERLLVEVKKEASLRRTLDEVQYDYKIAFCVVLNGFPSYFLYAINHANCH